MLQLWVRLLGVGGEGGATVGGCERRPAAGSLSLPLWLCRQKGSRPTAPRPPRLPPSSSPAPCPGPRLKKLRAAQVSRNLHSLLLLGLRGGIGLLGM